MICFFLQYKMTFFIINEFYNNYEMKIYVDVLFFENFTLDFILLLTTKIICGGKIKILRIIMGSVIGSLYTVLSFILNFQNMFLTFIFSLVIIFVCFGYKKLKIFLKYVGVFYLASITFGGASLIFIDCQNLIKILLLGFTVGFLLIVNIQKVLKKNFEKICEIEIIYNGNSVRTKALIDSRKFIKRRNFEFAGCNCRS